MATLTHQRHRLFYFIHFGRCMWKGLVDTVMHDGVEHAGYLAFLTLLSVFPFLVFFFSLIGFLGDTSLGKYLISIILHEVPGGFIEALKPRLEEIASGPPQGLMTIAILGAIWTASSALEGMRTILNRAYRVATPPIYILRRLLSIVEIFFFTGLLLIAMLVLILVPPVWELLKQELDISIAFNNYVEYIRLGAAGMILFLVISILYFILPNIKLKWVSVAPGALLVVIGWVLSAEIFSIYLTHFHQVNIIYGSLGGVIVALLFFYFLSMIFVFGAEFNYHWENGLGHKLEIKETVESAGHAK